MSKRYTILIGLILTAMPAAAMAQAVRLKADVRITGQQVRLADIATVLGLPTAARAMVVATLTDEAANVRVDMARMEKALRRNGINPVPIRFSGAAVCVISRPKAPPAPVTAGAVRPAIATPVAVEPIRAAVEPKPAAAARTIGERIHRQLVAQLGAAAKDITVEFAAHSQATADATATDRTSILSTDRRSLGQRRWRVDYTHDGHPRTKYIAATVTVRRKVVKAARALAVGETLTAADIELADHVDTGRGEFMVDPALVVGQQVKRALEAGSLMSARRLTSPILIKRGQDVWVQCGPVRLSVRALDSGRLGEQVTMENTQSKGRFRAVVTGPGQAEVSVAAPAPSRKGVQ